MFRIATVAALVAAALTVPAQADTTEGIVAIVDQRTGTIVMTDRTVWTLPLDMIEAPLNAGDRILIDFDSAGEDGLTAYNGIWTLANVLAADHDGGA